VANFVLLKDMSRYLDMVDELLMVEGGLTEKEVDFIDGLPDWNGCFTIGQAEWLERIWNKLNK